MGWIHIFRSIGVKSDRQNAPPFSPFSHRRVKAGTTHDSHSRMLCTWYLPLTLAIIIASVFKRQKIACKLHLTFQSAPNKLSRLIDRSVTTFCRNRCSPLSAPLQIIRRHQSHSSNILPPLTYLRLPPPIILQPQHCQNITLAKAQFFRYCRRIGIQCSRCYPVSTITNPRLNRCQTYHNAISVSVAAETQPYSCSSPASFADPSLLSAH